MNLRRALFTAVLIVIMIPSQARAVDFRFTINRGALVVHSQSQKDGRVVADLAESAYPGMAKLFNFRPAKKITLFVFDNSRDYYRLTPSRSSVAESVPSADEIYIIGNQPNLQMIVRHELVHIYFLGSLHRPREVPFWFSEGLAIYYSRPGEMANSYEAEALTGKLPPITSSAGQIRQNSVNSAQGYLMVRFISEKWGRKSLTKIVAKLQAGEDFNTATRQVLGVNSVKLNDYWRRYGAERVSTSRWEYLRFAGLTLIGFLAILVPFMWHFQYRRRLSQMDDEERY